MLGVKFSIVKCVIYNFFSAGVWHDTNITVSKKPNNINNEQYNTDTNELVKKIEADLVYIDPPYNSRQYCDAYHLLENVACWKKPDVEGTARKMDRSHLKSDYCTRSAPKAFEDLIDNIKAKYILVSYNNMGWTCTPSNAASRAGEIIVKSATILVGFFSGSSCRKGTK